MRVSLVLPTPTARWSGLPLKKWTVVFTGLAVPAPSLTQWAAVAMERPSAMTLPEQMNALPLEYSMIKATVPLLLADGL